MLKKQNQLEIWFLTGSQSLYGEAVLAQVASQSQSVVQSMNDSDTIPIKIVWKPVLTNPSVVIFSLI